MSGVAIPWRTRKSSTGRANHHSAAAGIATRASSPKAPDKGKTSATARNASRTANGMI